MNEKTQELITLIYKKLKNNKTVKLKINRNEVEAFVRSLIKNN